MSKNELNLETSQIAWHELQRFFANGSAIAVSKDIDLVEVAYHFSQDSKLRVEQLLNEKKISLVSDQQALSWYEDNSMVWAVVVKPWVLVQEIKV